MDMDSRLEKTFAMMDVSVHTANGVKNILKTLPRTGKKGRNIFVKPYNRRPRNKQKRALATAKAAMIAVMGAMQLHAVMVRPIPKYEKGTT